MLRNKLLNPVTEILNLNHQIPNNTEIQKSKVKNQNDNLKCKVFNLCSVTLHFVGIYLLFGFCHLELICHLGFDIWNLFELRVLSFEIYL